MFLSINFPFFKMKSVFFGLFFLFFFVKLGLHFDFEIDVESLFCHLPSLILINFIYVYIFYI